MEESIQTTVALFAFCPTPLGGQSSEFIMCLMIGMKSLVLLGIPLAIGCGLQKEVWRWVHD